MVRCRKQPGRRARSRAGCCNVRLPYCSATTCSKRPTNSSACRQRQWGRQTRALVIHMCLGRVQVLPLPRMGRRGGEQRPPMRIGQEVTTASGERRALRWERRKGRLSAAASTQASPPRQGAPSPMLWPPLSPPSGKTGRDATAGVSRPPSRAQMQKRPRPALATRDSDWRRRLLWRRTPIALVGAFLGLSWPQFAGHAPRSSCSLGAAAAKHRRRRRRRRQQPLTLRW